MASLRDLMKLAILAALVMATGCASPEDEPLGVDEVAEELATAESMEAGGDETAANDEAVEDFGSEEEMENEIAQQEAEAAPEEPALEEQSLEDEFAEMSEEAPAEEAPVVDAMAAAPEEFSAEPEPEPAPVEAAAADPFMDGSTPALVTDIAFSTNQNGGTVTIKTNEPVKYSTRYNAKTQQYVVELQNTRLSAAMKRPYIMKDFETPFGAINAYQNSGSSTARIVVQMKTGGEPIVQQEGDTLVVLPPSAEAIAASGVDAPRKKEAWEESYDVEAADQAEKILGARSLDEFLTGSGRFYGRPISIQTNDADVRDVISFIAEESGVNLVIGDDVEGKISLKLRQVPWDQALVILMKAKNLGYVRQGNVIRITKLATLQEEAKAAKSIVEAQKTLTPLRVKVIPISYAVVADLEKQVKPFLTPERGRVVSDARTSSLIVTDTMDVLEKVERLVKNLDIPPAQVMIEGKIVEATERFSRTLGVNWSWGGHPMTLSTTGGPNASPITMNAGFGSTPLTREQAAAAFGVFDLRVGRFDFFGDLNASLSLAQADSLIKIVSSPRVVTMNKEKAEISQKGEVLTINTIRDQQNNTQTNVERTPVELKLSVTPQITNEGSVLLDIDVLRQFAGAQVDAQSKARPVNSRSAKTKVLVPNGQTAVIGGIYQSEDQATESGVPGLKDIPILGWLFKAKVDEREKNELIIFLTPRILNAKDQSVIN